MFLSGSLEMRTGMGIGIDMNNSNLEGVNALKFEDGGSDEGISWVSSYARIDVAPIISKSDGTVPSGENRVGSLRLINAQYGNNQGGIALLDSHNITLVATGSNVGIGASNPQKLLEVKFGSTTNSVSTANDGIALFNSASNGGTHLGGIHFRRYDNAGLSTANEKTFALIDTQTSDWNRNNRPR
jgi:hypothetical protein